MRLIAGLVGVALLAFGLGAPPASAQSSASAASVEHEPHAISANHDRHSTSLRSGQQVELVTTEQRAIVRTTVDTVAVWDSSTYACAPAQEASRWCDVVQCRRLAGALLLGYATPPPARTRG